MDIENVEPISYKVLIPCVACTLLLAAGFLKGRKLLRERGKSSGFVMSRWHLFVLFLFAAGMLLAFHIREFGYNTATWVMAYIITSALLGGYVFTCWRRKSIFKYDALHRRNATNHWFQLSILIAFAIFIGITVWCFDINGGSFLPVSILAVVLTWLFQDTVLGVVAYFHLRMNRHLRIGDLINIPDKGITGHVADISLISVTIDRLDNMRSSLPITALMKNPFTNMQHMMDGNTSGRSMTRSFIIDSGSIADWTVADIDRLAEEIKKRNEDALAVTEERKKILAEDRAGVLNIFLFRRYLRHWLCRNRDVARSPRMIVGLEEPTVEGVPLKLSVFLKNTDLEPFEHQVSDITEHVLMSMEWFGLRLYQRPSSRDINNTNKQNNETSA